MKIIVVGGVAAGASFAARARRLDENAEIIIYEKSGYVSFANCGMPYAIGNTITDENQLIITSPQKLEGEYNVKVHILHEVVEIDRSKKEVSVKNLKTDETFKESYDKLILATGAKPFKPPMEGINLENIFSLRCIEDMQIIKKKVDAVLKKKEKPKAAIIGAGFIGVEVAEQLQEKGVDVTIIELLDQVLPPFDREMTIPVGRALKKNGIKLLLKEKVTHFSTLGDDKSKINVHLGSNTLPVDFVILSIGVRPDSELAVKAKLEVSQRGSAILVNSHQQSVTDSDIYAIGDNCVVKDIISENETCYIPLAGPANKQGRIAASHIFGHQPDEFKGVQGSSIIKAYDVVAACTGYSEKLCKIRNIKNFDVVYIHEFDHVPYYPNPSRISLKLVYDKVNGKVYGCQIVGGLTGVESCINIVSTAIQAKMTVYDLEDLELAYCPAYGAAKNPINMLGYAAANNIRGVADFVPYYTVKEQVEKNIVQLRKNKDEFLPNFEKKQVIFVDVRPTCKLGAGLFCENSIHIPLCDLRKKYEQIIGDTSLYEEGKNNEIWVSCVIGKSAYFAYRILKQKGYHNLKIVSGGCEAINRLWE